ncbi:hypothetical protein BC834DRAFT_967267 [Gloeopeniophorella convolvens]|nr:hypothetical protein BC834DRAFT_967267 [Gloeopeniophorella convolvens]
MLDFDPPSLHLLPQRMHPAPLYSTAYPSYSPPPLAPALIKQPNSPPAYPYASSPAPQPFTFDPFADEDSSTSSGVSERERELEAQRVRRVEFLRHREWMRRVVAWVDGVSHGMTPASPPSAKGSSPYKHAPAEAPTLYYSSSSSLAARSDEDDAPYVIYSTPLPGAPPPPPAPAPVPVPAQYTPAAPQTPIPPPPRAPSARRIHGRVRSLSSIREEDEGRA